MFKLRPCVSIRLSEIRVISGKYTGKVESRIFRYIFDSLSKGESWRSNVDGRNFRYNIRDFRPFLEPFWPFLEPKSTVYVENFRKFRYIIPSNVQNVKNLENNRRFSTDTVNFQQIPSFFENSGTFSRNFIPGNQGNYTGLVSNEKNFGQTHGLSLTTYSLC